MILRPSSKILLLRSGVEVISGKYSDWRRISVSTMPLIGVANSNQLFGLRESFMQVGTKK